MYITSLVTPTPLLPLQIVLRFNNNADDDDNDDDDNNNNNNNNNNDVARRPIANQRPKETTIELLGNGPLTASEGWCFLCTPCRDDTSRTVSECQWKELS
jgi:hypothetical protein